MTSKPKYKKSKTSNGMKRQGKGSGIQIKAQMHSKKGFKKSPNTPTKVQILKMAAKRASAEHMSKVTTPKIRYEPKKKPLDFQQMRNAAHQRQTQSRNNSRPNIIGGRKLKSKSSKGGHMDSGRPTFQFKIGLQVGTALGDCYLQVQKLENSMDKLATVSEDISDVLQYLHENNIGMDENNYQPKSKHFKNLQENQRRKTEIDADSLVENPLEEVSILNENLCDWQRDSLLRMQAMSKSVRSLQSKLEELDDHHQQAQSLARSTMRNHDIDEAYRTISELQNEMYKTKMLLQDKNLEIQRLKQRPKPTTSEELGSREKELERKEKELDHDAELIATQSEELRKESNRLLAEREEVRKQKENWTNMIKEVKEQKEKLDKRESEVNANHQKLFELHETLQAEKVKLHRKAKKIKSREKRLNQLRNANGSYVQPNFSQSDYAESELTYFSDGDTAIESVNSISDDESQDNFHKSQMQSQMQGQMQGQMQTNHLGIPDHGQHY